MSEIDRRTSRAPDGDVLKLSGAPDQVAAGAAAKWQTELQGMTDQLRRTVAPLVHSIQLLGGGRADAPDEPTRPVRGDEAARDGKTPDTAFGNLNEAPIKARKIDREKGTFEFHFPHPVWVNEGNGEFTRYGVYDPKVDAHVVRGTFSKDTKTHDITNSPTEGVRGYLPTDSKEGDGWAITRSTIKKPKADQESEVMEVTASWGIFWKTKTKSRPVGTYDDWHEIYFGSQGS